MYLTSIPLESASHLKDVSSKLKAELPLLAVIVLSSLEESEEIVSLYELIVISSFVENWFWEQQEVYHHCVCVKHTLYLVLI